MFSAERRAAPSTAGATTPLRPLGIAVPVLGMMTAASMDVLAQAWVIVSMRRTLVASLVLALVVLPRQQTLLADVTARSGTAAEVAVAARQKIGRL
jgi:hypothetical protein